MPIIYADQIMLNNLYKSMYVINVPTSVQHFEALPKKVKQKS